MQKQKTVLEANKKSIISQCDSFKAKPMLKNSSVNVKMNPGFIECDSVLSHSNIQIEMLPKD